MCALPHTAFWLYIYSWITELLRGYHTQLAIFRAPKRIEVSFAVHQHAEFSPAGHLGNRLPIVHDLKREVSQLSALPNSTLARSNSGQ